MAVQNSCKNDFFVTYRVLFTFHFYSQLSFRQEEWSGIVKGAQQGTVVVF